MYEKKIPNTFFIILKKEFLLLRPFTAHKKSNILGIRASLITIPNFEEV